MTPKISLFLVCLLLFSSCAFDDYYSESETGTGGSMARFTVIDNHLYTVDQSNLNTFDISNPQNIKHNQRQSVGYGIETIFPQGGKLFLGARNGMYIYDLQNPDKPQQMSYTEHFWSNDPVVVKGDYAYVTLRTNDFSWRNQNVLQVYDISNSYNPKFIVEYEMDGPKGLAVDDNKIFICDKYGLKIFELFNDTEITIEQPLATFPIKANDVIPKGEILHVIADDGFYNYDYSGNNIELLGKINIPLN